MPVIRPSRGVHLGLGEAGPSHCAEALNVFWRNGALCGRAGGRASVICPFNTQSDPVIASADWPTSAAIGTWATTAERNSLAANPLAGSNAFFVGFENPFNAFTIGLTINTCDLSTGALSDAWKGYYWNGTEMVPLSMALRWKGTADSANDVFEIMPGVAYNDDGAPTSLGVTMAGSFEPPSDWATRVVDGFTCYWIVMWLENTSNFTLLNASPNNGGGCAEDECATVFIDSWRGRNGDYHQVSVFADESGPALRWVVDGANFTNATDFLGAASWETDIQGGYVPVVDKWIGRIKGHGWVLLNLVTSTVEDLEAGGGDTVYEPLETGLRTVIPNGGPVAMVDGRWVTIEGSQVIWSAPGPFVDVWPNEFETFLQDGKGNGVAVVSIREWAAIFTERGVYRFASDGSADGYSAELVTGNVGCVGPRAACAVGDVVMFLSTDGIYQLTSAGDLTKMSGAINAFFSEHGITALDRAQLVYDPTFDQLRVFLCSNNESHVFDMALYADAEGYVENDAGQPRQEMAWWPQGRDTPDQYGFQGTYVHVDQAKRIPVTLLGDRYGCVWECDQVEWEGGAITRRFMSSHINVDSSQQAIVRWVNVGLRNYGNTSLQVIVRPDGLASDDHEVSCDVYVSASAEIADDTTLVDTTSLVQDSEVAKVCENSFEVRGRSFQVGLLQEQEFFPLEVIGVEVEATRAAKRGGR